MQLDSIVHGGCGFEYNPDPASRHHTLDSALCSWLVDDLRNNGCSHHSPSAALFEAKHPFCEVPDNEKWSTVLLGRLYETHTNVFLLSGVSTTSSSPSLSCLDRIAAYDLLFCKGNTSVQRKVGGVVVVYPDLLHSYRMQQLHLFSAPPLPHAPIRTSVRPTTQ